MNKAAQFLKDCGTFYLATVDGDQARVRPFGAVAEFEGRTYICTNNTKKCFKQMLANPKIEISGMVGGNWIRLTGEAIRDERKEAKQAMLDANPSLTKMYNPEDGIFEVLYFANATAVIASFTGEPEVISL